MWNKPFRPPNKSLWNDPDNDVTIYVSCKIKRQNYLSQQSSYPFTTAHSNGGYQGNSYDYSIDNKDHIIQTVKYSFFHEKQNKQVLNWK